MYLAILIISLAGLICAVILAIAAKYMAVAEVEGFSEIREALPGANCGACGYAGCDDYAKKLASDHSTPTNLCPVGGASTVDTISALLGVEAGALEQNVAIVNCCGTKNHTQYIMEYNGVTTCEACNLFYQGRGKCSHACLGYGDCVDACQFDALHIRDGVAVVTPELCTACGACIKKCPNKLIELIPAASRVFVTCSSHDKGAHTRKACSAGCIGCKKCEKVCPSAAIAVTDNLAKIDYTKCTNCGACVEACPTHVIHQYGERVATAQQSE